MTLRKNRIAEAEQVHAALFRVGACSKVPYSIMAIEEIDTSRTTILVEIVLHYRRKTPVCCPEPGCYVPFLGAARSATPAALQDALNLLEKPQIVMRVFQEYENGYEHISFPGPTRNASFVLEAEHFR